MVRNYRRHEFEPIELRRNGDNEDGDGADFRGFNPETSASFPRIERRKQRLLSANSSAQILGETIIPPFFIFLRSFSHIHLFHSIIRLNFFRIQNRKNTLNFATVFTGKLAWQTMQLKTQIRFKRLGAGIVSEATGYCPEKSLYGLNLKLCMRIQAV